MSALFRIGSELSIHSAGLGAVAALKGSDGVAEQALAMRRRAAAQQLVDCGCSGGLWPLRRIKLRITRCPGLMGAALLEDMGFKHEVVASTQRLNKPLSEIYERLAEELQARGVDCCWFAGGDGTARNILQ